MFPKQPRQTFPFGIGGNSSKFWRNTCWHGWWKSSSKCSNETFLCDMAISRLNTFYHTVLSLKSRSIVILSCALVSFKTVKCTPKSKESPFSPQKSSFYRHPLGTPPTSASTHSRPILASRGAKRCLSKKRNHIFILHHFTP